MELKVGDLIISRKPLIGADYRITQIISEDNIIVKIIKNSGTIIKNGSVYKTDTKYINYLIEEQLAFIERPVENKQLEFDF